jgi:hypothetical protein
MTLADLRRAAELLPAGSALTLPREALLEALLAALDESDNDRTNRVPIVPMEEASSAAWQERLWTANADTRMTLADVCEALSRPKSWGYRHTSPRSGLPRIPHRKLDGELVFVAGEVRVWVREHEDIVVESTPITPIHRRRSQSHDRPMHASADR